MTALNAQQQKIVDDLIGAGRLPVASLKSINNKANKALGRPVIKMAEGGLANGSYAQIDQFKRTFTNANFSVRPNGVYDKEASAALRSSPEFLAKYDINGNGRFDQTDVTAYDKAQRGQRSVGGGDADALTDEQYAKVKAQVDEDFNSMFFPDLFHDIV